jgi:hypothetical protein
MFKTLALLLVQTSSTYSLMAQTFPKPPQCLNHFSEFSQAMLAHQSLSLLFQIPKFMLKHSNIT